MDNIQKILIYSSKIECFYILVHLASFIEFKVLKFSIFGLKDIRFINDLKIICSRNAFIHTNGVDECYMVNNVTFTQIKNYFAIRRRFFENIAIRNISYYFVVMVSYARVLWLFGNNKKLIDLLDDEVQLISNEQLSGSQLLLFKILSKSMMNVTSKKFLLKQQQQKKKKWASGYRSAIPQTLTFGENFKILTKFIKITKMSKLFVTIVYVFMTTENRLLAQLVNCHIRKLDGLNKRATIATPSLWALKYFPSFSRESHALDDNT
ncbi:hypothetical protein AGLY_015268 [Aphis glycines]|uniref:Uncharacterized protein n=1 Tax=Aphis glycines TaxID=307491 RepID=A0A6G0T0X6_APHGL|nr:hypothetical protein AGLY_015268 [Aphis glycines]